MKKLSKEERTALKTGLSKFKTLLLFVLLSEIISPQIPFKGFCKLNSFSIDSGFTKIFSFNYDQNEHSDLLVYNPVEKKPQFIMVVPVQNLLQIKLSHFHLKFHLLSLSFFQII